MVYLLNCHSNRKRLMNHQVWIPMTNRYGSYAISCGSHQDDCLFVHYNPGTSNVDPQEMHQTSWGIHQSSSIISIHTQKCQNPVVKQKCITRGVTFHFQQPSAGRLWAPPLRPFARARNCWDWELLPKAIERHRFCAPPGSQKVFGISVWSCSQLGAMAKGLSQTLCKSWV